MKEVVRRAHVLLWLLVFLTLAASVYIVFLQDILKPLAAFDFLNFVVARLNGIACFCWLYMAAQKRRGLWALFGLAGGLMAVLVYFAFLFCHEDFNVGKNLPLNLENRMNFTKTDAFLMAYFASSVLEWIYFEAILNVNFSGNWIYVLNFIAAKLGGLVCACFLYGVAGERRFLWFAFGLVADLASVVVFFLLSFMAGKKTE